jgi:integrase
VARISKRTVDAAGAPESGRAYLWDDKLSGFGLVVQTSGSKSYVYQYRTPEGQTRRITIGRHGDPFTPELARDKAIELAQSVKAGNDPLVAKKERRNAATVADLLGSYLKSPKFASKAESTQAIDRGRINRHLVPLLGRKVADKLNADDIHRAFAAIRDGKTAINVRTGKRGLARVTGGEGSARMAVRLLKAVFAWAVEAKLLTGNPAASVKVGNDGKRSEVIESAEQYATLFTTIQALEDQMKVRRPAADAIRVIALTGARRGEIAGLRWRHVDTSKGLIVLSSKEHKTGRKTSEARTIGLPAAAQALITRQPAAAPDEFVFRPAKGKGAITLSKPWRVIRAAAGLSPTIGLHGLRHSLATQMALSGAQAAQIMTVLGHKNITTAQRYIHMAQDMRAQLAESAAAGISAALTGKKPADLVPLKGQTTDKRR